MITALLFSFAQGDLDTELLAEDLDSPIWAEAIPAEPNLLWIVERDGRVLRLDLRSGEKEIVLDISDRISTRSERGLLCIAFPREAMDDSLFYLHFNNDSGESIVARCRPQEEEPVEILFTQKQPYANHNGGQLAFGPDGMLFLGLGDGGAANDPKNSGQDLNSALGKILRWHAPATGPLQIPADNPFLNQEDSLDSIWLWGLRNPWRFSFDRKSGDLWIGDVGQNKWEEVDRAPAGKGGLNFGWRIREGFHPFREKEDDGRERVDPVWEYSHGGKPVSNSITGGFVYRGQQLPKDYQGHYFFGDWTSGKVWSGKLNSKADKLQSVAEIPSLNFGPGLVSFAEDAHGEILILNLFQGKIRRIQTKAAQ